MDEGRKRVLGIVAGILVTRHLKTTDDLFDTFYGPRTAGMKTPTRSSTCLVIHKIACAGWMVAQETYGSQSTRSANESTIQGCLSGSAGSYTLADKSGKSYRLEGDPGKLSAHVGHEVRVTGTEPTAASSGSQAGTTTGATTAQAKTQFNVTKVEHVASTCSTAQK